MIKIQNTKQYDLEERTFGFAKNCRNLTKKLPKNTSNFEYIKQLVRSSGSQVANYIEANESLSKKDFAYRIRICRKETKESCLWLKLVETEDKKLDNELNNLINEAIELRKIFNSILNKSI